MTEEMKKEEVQDKKTCEDKNIPHKDCKCHAETVESLEEKDKCNCDDCDCESDDCTDCDGSHDCKSLQLEVSQLNSEIEKLKLLNKELSDKVQYTQAEMINFRRRKEEEYQNKSKYANQDLITEIIPIVDNFERAIKYDDNDLTDELSKFLDGFKMMYSQLTNILRNFGVEEISRVGEIFDSNLEEALMTDSIDGYKDDEVLEVLLKGYKLKDRVIRPATVKVNKIKNEKEK